MAGRIRQTVRMTMAGEILTAEQQTLWKRADQRGGLNSMTDRELQVWAAACRKLADRADRGPKKAAKARRMWMIKLREADEALASTASRTGGGLGAQMQWYGVRCIFVHPDRGASHGVASGHPGPGDPTR